MLPKFGRKDRRYGIAQGTIQTKKNKYFDQPLIELQRQ